MPRDLPQKKTTRSTRLRRSAQVWPTVEEQMSQAMQREGVSSAELARRVGVPRAGICRDLKGGLGAAKLRRLQEIAGAIRHDVFVFVAPRDGKLRKALVASLLRSLHQLSAE